MRAVLLILFSVCGISLAAPTPAKAEDADWRDCRQEADRDLGIRGCTSILARGDKETLVNRAGAYLNRGIAYRAKGDPSHAIADYDEALRLHPKFAPAYNSRGNAYSDKGDGTRAIADYDEAIRLDPKYAVARPG